MKANKVPTDELSLTNRAVVNDKEELLKVRYCIHLVWNERPKQFEIDFSESTFPVSLCLFFFSMLYHLPE